MANGIIALDKDSMRPFIKFVIDDAGAAFTMRMLDKYTADLQLRVLTHARLVGWTRLGNDPVVIAVRSYLPGITLEVDAAVELAIDWMQEINALPDPTDPAPDFVL